MKYTAIKVYSVEKINGTNRYELSIVHTVYDHPVYFAVFGLVSEIFTVQYSWKNARRSMNNLRLYPTKTFSESLKKAELKIKQMDEKIK